MKDEAFTGYETKTSIPTGIIACKKNNEFIKLLLEDYKNREFIKKDGTFDYTTNVEQITNYVKEKFNFKANGKCQKLDYGFTIYPKDFFALKIGRMGT